jgi:hypothetical protein
LVDLVKVWILLVGTSAWLEHLILGEWLPASLHFLFNLLQALEFLPQRVLSKNAGLVWMLIGLIWLEKCCDVVLSVRMNVAWRGVRLLDLGTWVSLGRLRVFLEVHVLLGLVACGEPISELLLMAKRTAAAMIAALDVLAGDAVERLADCIGAPEQLPALLQDRGWAHNGVAEEHFRALGALLKLVGWVVGRSCLRCRALQLAWSLREVALEHRPLGTP